MAKKKAARTKRAKNVKEVDIVKMSWNDLRAFAKAHHIPAKGTRPELEAKIKQQLKIQGGVVPKLAKPKKAAAKKAVPKKPVSKESAPKKPDTYRGFDAPKKWYRVKATGAEGYVIDGPPITLRLEGGQGNKTFSSNELDAID